MQIRFVVGVPGVSMSNSWKLWTQGDEAYLLSRGTGSVCKFSFHKSGICRYALVKSRADGGDRAMDKWTRGPVPPPGSQRAELLLSIVIPTSHLSASREKFPKQMTWIEPAPLGKATRLEVFLTNEGKVSVNRAFAKRNERRLLAFGALRNGTKLGLASAHIDCEPIDLKSPADPAVPGIVFADLVFPEHDELGTGRPVRMTTIWPAAQNGGPPTVLELGGYEIGKRERETATARA